MIQGSINQLLHQGSLLMHLNPNLEDKLEMRKLDKQSKTTKKMHNIEKNRGPMSIERQQEFATQNLEIAQAQYELDPTQKRFENLEEYKKQFEIGEERLTEKRLMAQHRRAQAEAQINLGLEQTRVGRKLMENAPTPMAGKKETIKYDNI